MATKKTAPKKNYQLMSDVDVAYEILDSKKEPVYYRDLIMEVIELKNKPVQSLSSTISEVYTFINMDSRFRFCGRDEAGKGLWGLTEWEKAEPKRAATRSERRSASAKQNRREEVLLKSIQED